MFSPHVVSVIGLECLCKHQQRLILQLSMMDVFLVMKSINCDYSQMISVPSGIGMITMSFMDIHLLSENLSQILFQKNNICFETKNNMRGLTPHIIMPFVPRYVWRCQLYERCLDIDLHQHCVRLRITAPHSV